MSTMRGSGCGAKEVVQLQPLERGLRLDDLEDDLRQADLGPHGKDAVARREDCDLERIQIENGPALQCMPDAA